MPFALDVLYCRIPGDGDWRNVVIGELPGILGDEDQGLARLSALLAQGDVDEQAPAVLGDESVEDVLPGTVLSGGLLGVETDTPAIADLTLSMAAGGERGGYDRWDVAQSRMTTLKEQRYDPDPHAHAVYSELYALYRELHDSFGGVGNGRADFATLMKRLLAMLERDLQDAGIGAEVCDLSAAPRPKRRGPSAAQQKSGEKRKRSREGRKPS